VPRALQPSERQASIGYFGDTTEGAGVCLLAKAWYEYA